MSALVWTVLLAGGGVGVAALRRWRAGVARRFEEGDASRRPRQANGVVVGADPIRLAGRNGAAVLVLHGFNDTPQSMAYLCERLNAAGYTVSAPRLPGHGGSLQEMARDMRAAAWRDTVRAAYDALARSHPQVFVCGQSMGGALSVLLATERPTMAGLALLAPFLDVPSAQRWQFRFAALHPAPYLRSTGGERSIHDPDARRQALTPGLVTGRALLALARVATDANRSLKRLRAPTLYVQSREDNRISFALAERHFRDISAPVKKNLWLDGCGHIISADYRKADVADAVIDWFERRRME